MTFVHWAPSTQRVEGTLPPIVLTGTRPTAAWLRVAAEGATRFCVLLGLLARLTTVCCSSAAFAGSRASCTGDSAAPCTCDCHQALRLAHQIGEHPILLHLQPAGRADRLTKLVSLTFSSIYSQADRLTKLVSIALAPFSSICTQFRTSQRRTSKLRHRCNFRTQ